MTVGEPARAQDRDAALASMDNDPKPLSVIVIGAGIAGLTAAAALRKAGPHCSDEYQACCQSTDTGY